MADRILGSNETLTSWTFDEEVFPVSLARSTSAHTGSAIDVYAGAAKANGRIVDFWFVAETPAVSASGFVSADISAAVRINSVAVLSTNPVVKGPLGSAGAAGRQATNKTFTSAAGKPSPVSAVVNSASANFSTGDIFTVEYNLNSVGSAAAGAAGVGFLAMVKVRYAYE